MDERAQIFNFLLAKCDEKNAKIAALEAQVKELTEKVTSPAPAANQ